MKLCCLEAMIRTLLSTLLTGGLMHSFHLNLVHPKSATVTVFRARTWEEGLFLQAKSTGEKSQLRPLGTFWNFECENAHRCAKNWLTDSDTNRIIFL